MCARGFLARLEKTGLTTFAELGLGDRVLDTIESEGYEVPTPIQAKAIPPALEGCDVLGCAQTGTGKTAAFALPVIHRLLEMGKPDQALKEAFQEPQHPF